MELSNERAIKNMKRDTEHDKEETEKQHRHKIEEIEKHYFTRLQESSAKIDELKMSYHTKLAEAKEKYVKEVNRVGYNFPLFCPFFSLAIESKYVGDPMQYVILKLVCYIVMFTVEYCDVGKNKVQTIEGRP